MKKHSFLAIALTGATLAISAPGAFAQAVTGTPITSDTSGNTLPDKISVGGFIEEFIEINSDPTLEFGDLGGPQALGWRASSQFPVANNGDAATNNAGLTPATVVGQTGTGTAAGTYGNGTAEVTGKSNTYITLTSGTGSNLKYTAANNDVYTLDTRFRQDFYGRKVVVNGTPVSALGINDRTAYSTSYAPSGAANAGGSSITFGPSQEGFGLKMIGLVDRKGLTDHSGQYSTSFTLSFSKF